MCKGKQRFDLEYMKKLAIQWAIFMQNDVAVYVSESGGYNFCPLDFAEINNRTIVFTYKP